MERGGIDISRRHIRISTVFYGVTSHLLSFNEFLPHRLEGAADEEKGHISALNDGLDFGELLNWEEGSELIFTHYRSPKNPQRQLFALNITHLAILYVFMHELGHAYYSHNEFLEDLFGLKTIQEMQNKKSINTDLTYIMQRFELLADGFAIDLSLNTRLGAFSSGVEDGSDYYSWSIAVDLLLWVFGQKLLLTAEPGSHPHPQIRILNKLFHLQKTDYGNPSRNITYIDHFDLSISKISVLASVDIFEFWKTNKLPGWNNSFLSEETARAKSELMDNIRLKDTELWRKYERYVDRRLLNEVVKIFSS